MRSSFVVTVVLGLSLAGPRVPAADLKAVLDSAADTRLFDTHFARYGPPQPKWILREGNGIRFRVPAVKDVPQTGEYAYFAMAGDFDVSVNYQIVALPPPQSGFGTAFGLAVDAETERMSIALTRAVKPDGGSGLIVTRGLPAEGGQRYKEGAFQPTTAKRGTLVLRREKAEIICLASESGKELAEVGRFPFTAATVRKVRVFADPGGSPTGIDAKLFDFKAQAEEITGGTPQRELTGPSAWWWVAGLTGLGGLLALYYRRKRA